MQTGAATATCAVLALFYYLIPNISSVAGAVVFLLVRFYILTLLYSLNLRGTRPLNATTHEKVDNGHAMALNTHATQGMVGAIGECTSPPSDIRQVDWCHHIDTEPIRFNRSSSDGPCPHRWG